MRVRWQVRRHTLLLLAALVWSVAGANILRIGLLSYPGRVRWWTLLLSLLVYLLFQLFVFGKMVAKHTARILGYEEEYRFFWQFFDRRGFLIMLFMMTFGIGLRVSGLAPLGFIAVFYTGLGAALTLAGLHFLLRYVQFVIAYKNREDV